MPGPPIILPASTDANGISLLRYRHRLAELLGFFLSSTVNTVAASLEAERYILSDAVKSDAADPSQFDGMYAFIRTGVEAGTQRKLVNNGWDGPRGSLLVDFPYPDPLAAGSGFELSVLPAQSYLGVTGMNPIINESLEALPLIDIVSATAVANQSEYQLIDYPWPIKAVTKVFYPRSSTTNEPRREVPKTWDFVMDAEVPVLSFYSQPFTAGDVFEIEVHRPANTRIRQSGAWGDVLVGLTDDTDEALYDVLTVVNVAYPIALERLKHLYGRGSKERAQIEGEAEDAHVTAVFAKFYGRFRGNGVQKVGVGRSSRTWWNSR